MSTATPTAPRPYFTEPTPEFREARRTYDVAIAAWKTSTNDPKLVAELMTAQETFTKALQTMLNEFTTATAARNAAYYASNR